MKLKLAKTLLCLGTIGGVAVSSALIATSCGADKSRYKISMTSTASSINYEGEATITASCTSGVAPTLTATATSGEGSIWNFTDNSNGTWTLTYEAETATSINVTITATSPEATTKKTTVTLLAHDTISLNSSASTINYQEAAEITATTSTGAYPTLTASSTSGGSGSVWTFDDVHNGTGTLTYIGNTSEAIEVTITATSPGAVQQITHVTLTQHDTITIQDYQPNLSWDGGTSFVIITATTATDIIPTLTATDDAEGEGINWTFQIIGEGIGKLTYIGETATAIDVTITASSPFAEDQTAEVTLLAHDTITFGAYEDTLDWVSDGLGTMSITATTATGAFPTLSASGTGKDEKWRFDTTGPGAGSLVYAKETTTSIVVTIYAESPAAEREEITVTLTPHDTIVLVTNTEAISYEGVANITATTSTGAYPTLTASADSGEGENWEFVYDNVGNATLTYIAETLEAIEVTITATSPLADEEIITITLLPHDTITLNSSELNFTALGDATITASCSSGTIPSVEANGSGEIDNWEFVTTATPGVWELHYYYAVTLVTEVTVTATSEFADKKIIIITLTP